MTKGRNERGTKPAADQGVAPAPHELDSQPPAPPHALAVADPAVADAIERQSRQIEELSRLTASLTELMAETRAQSQRDAAFLSAVESVRTASSAVTASTALRAMPAEAAGPHMPAARSAVERHPHEAVEDCGGGPCECTSTNCCCFQIWMKSVRVLSMQPFEVEDTNVPNPWGEIEVQMFAYLDGGIGAVIPSLFSFLTLSRLVQYPGPKLAIERPIGTVCLRKGTSRIVNVTVDAIESDKGLLERLTGGRDEEGSNTAFMVLDCCCSAEPNVVFDVQFTSGGQGGGAIQVEFAARRSC